MYTPISTYRLQVNQSFKFKDLKQTINYLENLGISTIYCAPFFEARPGSDHGYDVVNPYVINPEIGTIKDFEEIAALLKKKNMGWLQDIVPNHMAFDSNNVWLMDIFQKGIHSDFYDFFDIDWNHPDPKLSGKVIAPFLGSEPKQQIAERKITINYTQSGFFIKTDSLLYPLSWKSYYIILEQGIQHAEERNKESSSIQKLRLITQEFKTISKEFSNAAIANQAPHFLEQLYELYIKRSEVKHLIDSAINHINETAELLQEVLDLQFYQLAFYKVSDTKINYRRFFAVNELICISAENEHVFKQSHELIERCLKNKLIQGLRIDHIDGLYNPEAYLKNLRKITGDDVYIVVEKILGKEELLPDSWPIQGTSGYDFLGIINDLFTQSAYLSKLNRTYEDFVKHYYSYEELIFEAKVNFLCRKMVGELDNLFFLLNKTTTIPEESKLLYREALAVILASFPVYRIYPSTLPLHEKEIRTINEVISSALKFRPFLADQLHHLNSILIHDEHLSFLMRLQQFTGPLAAKGIEDTAFYVYNRLISHNEVGDSPLNPGSSIESFHEKMRQRDQSALSINGTSTHDTKRGEDSRIRINVLSELPDEWAGMLNTWKEHNANHKQTINGKSVPDSNTEYFIYQSLIGAYPNSGIDAAFIERLKQYMLKALREAKVHTDWANPNLAYEAATLTFIEEITTDQSFLAVFNPFAKKIADYGIALSLSQVLVKTTVPGIPDIYQGSELWDLSFVDPDNRRPVDFQLRAKYLKDIKDKWETSSHKLIKELIASKDDGRIKLFTTYITLEIRRTDPELFEKGEYIPLQFSGTKSNTIIGYARQYENRWAIIVAPKEVVELNCTDALPLGETAWFNTCLLLPENAPEKWLNVFTGTDYYVNKTVKPVSIQLFVSDEGEEATQETEEESVNQLNLSKLLKFFPVALLYSTGITTAAPETDKI